MAVPDALVGLVTHARSRFNAGGVAERQLERLAEELRERGLTVATLVSDRDDYDPARWPITRGEIVRTALAQARLERRWRAYVRGTQGLGDVAMESAMAVRRALGAAGRPSTSARGRALRRLLNIDLSHRRIWQEALALQAHAVLVLEDDAKARPGASGVLAGVIETMRALPSEERVLVNCSASIDTSVLGIETLLADAAPIGEPAGASLVELPRAATNTLCAVAYTPALARELVAHLDRGLLPAQPIDWRVNEAILADPRIRAWWLLPAPFAQGSMLVDP